MKKFIVMLVILALGCSSCFAGVDSHEYDNKFNYKQGIFQFIPEGWDLVNLKDGKVAIVKGDLNKDDIEDLVLVIEKVSESNERVERHLIIAFGTSDGKYQFSTQAEKAFFLDYNQDGYGDPFKSISIDRGSLLLEFYGGPVANWYRSYRFRYQEDDWYLIGATQGLYVLIDGEADSVQEDYNLLTGDYIFKKLEAGEIQTNKGNRGVRKLISLDNFDVSVMEYSIETLEAIEEQAYQESIWIGTYLGEYDYDDSEDYEKNRRSHGSYIEIDSIGKDKFSYKLELFKGNVKSYYSGSAKFEDDVKAVDTDGGFEFILSDSNLIVENKNTDKNYKLSKFNTITSNDFKLSNGVNLDLSHLNNTGYSEFKKVLDIVNDDYVEDDKEGYFVTVKTDVLTIGYGIPNKRRSVDNTNVTRYDLPDKAITTYRGIKVGDSVEKLVKQYGEPTYCTERFEIDAWDYTYMYAVEYHLHFNVRAGRIISIWI